MSADTTVLASAADASYGYQVLNLVGSVTRNSDIFDRIEIFDLGLREDQLRRLAAVRGVVVRDVPAFVPHWAQCFTWKPWAWMQVNGDRVFWIDAGATVLRSLTPALDQVTELGYFLVSQGGELRDILPPDYFDIYGLPQSVARRPYVAAGIIGFRPHGQFFERVLTPTYQDCLEGRNLGFSKGELSSKNRGIGYMAIPPVRNCPAFRWDQSILNAHVFSDAPDAVVADLDEYGGWRSAHDHPRQVIWHHRRRGSLRYLTRVPYTGAHARGRRAWGLWIRIRWWLKLREKFTRPSTYVLKTKRLRSRRSDRRRSSPT